MSVRLKKNRLRDIRGGPFENFARRVRLSRALPPAEVPAAAQSARLAPGLQGHAYRATSARSRGWSVQVSGFLLTKKKNLGNLCGKLERLRLVSATGADDTSDPFPVPQRIIN